jgi:hypothetical protein
VLQLQALLHATCEGCQARTGPELHVFLYAQMLRYAATFVRKSGTTSEVKVLYLL